MRVAGGVWTEPVQGGYPDPRLFLSLSGLDQIRAFVHGQSLAPPMAHLTGMRPTQVGPGTVTFSMPVTGWITSSPTTRPKRVAICFGDHTWKRN